MSKAPPSNVPSEGSVELQLLAIQRELSFFKSYYVEMNKKLGEINSQLGRLENIELFIKVSALFDEYLSNRWDE